MTPLLRALALASCTLCVVSCTSPPRLVVQLATDYTPLVDFDTVDVELPVGTTVTTVQARVRGGYANGARLLDRVGVTPGSTAVRVTLRHAGALLQAQTRHVVVGADTTYVTVRVTRSCAGVTCDQPDASACLAGMCTDDRCTPENPSACPTPTCTATSCAMSTVACAPSTCVGEGVCVITPDDTRCLASEICDAVRGCVPAPVLDAGAVDADVLDADLLDANLLDANTQDASPLDAPAAACFSDDFNDGDFTDWTNLDGTWSVDAFGPDGSNALAVTVPAGNSRLTHTMLLGQTPRTFSMAFRLDDMIDGDLDVYFLSGAWTDPDTTSRYDIGLHAVGADNLTDFVLRWDGPTPVTLTERPVSLVVGHWYRLDVDRSPDGSLHVRVDGAPYLDTPPDATYAPPYDIVVRAYRDAAIDDVVLVCGP